MLETSFDQNSTIFPKPNYKDKTSNKNMPKRKSLQEVIAEFKVCHGSKYDYSKVIYINTNSKVIVVCKKHGEFTITPGHHKKGVGCKRCHFQAVKISKKEFVKRSKKHFGNRYDYSSFTELSDFGSRIEIYCKEHDCSFSQEPRSHMRGHTGCGQCRSNILSGNKETIGQRKSQKQLNSDFTKKARKVHGKKFEYSKFIYRNSTTLGLITCKNHGEFEQLPQNHLQGRQCPACSREEQKEGTFKEVCKIRGVDYHTALKRRQAGHSEEKIFAAHSLRNEQEINPVTVDEIYYPNFEEAARALKPPASTSSIRRWTGDGMSPEEAFRRIPNPGYKKGIIYLVTNNLTGKKYVGLTIQLLDRRWQDHIEAASAGSIKDENSLHAAIREFGSSKFTIREIDKGATKGDLEKKERRWIARFGTIAPEGYNISSGGTSGGSNKQPTRIDEILFDGNKEASEYVAETRGISYAAAKKRISKGRVDVKTPSKPGKGYTKKKIYKAWSRIVYCALNPKSKDFIAGLAIHEPWRDFEAFQEDIGEPPDNNMSLTRLDQKKGFYPTNCAWLTRSESSRINAQHMKKEGRLTGNATKRK